MRRRFSPTSEQSPRDPPYPREACRSLSEALIAELALRRLILLKAIQAHATEYAGGFRELDLSVVDDLDVVAPRIVEVKRSGSLNLDAGLLQRSADRLLVIDDQSKVPCTIGQLRAPGRQRDELIADVDERHRRADPVRLTRNLAGPGPRTALGQLIHGAGRRDARPVRSADSARDGLAGFAALSLEGKVRRDGLLGVRNGESNRTAVLRRVWDPAGIPVCRLWRRERAW